MAVPEPVAFVSAQFQVMLLSENDESTEIGAWRGAMAADRGISMAGLALAWLLADGRVTQIVIGPGRPEHLAPVGEALAHPLTEQDKAEAERAVAS